MVRGGSHAEGGGGGVSGRHSQRRYRPRLHNVEGARLHPPLDVTRKAVMCFNALTDVAQSADLLRG